MEIAIITGLSGAGKSAAVSLLEDLSFNCVDNMPPVFISKFIEVCSSASNKFDKLGIVVDSRAGALFDDFVSELDKLEQAGININLIYLEATNETLIKRYKETRRRHPLIDYTGTLIDAINKEREMLTSIRQRADYIIDTSLLSSKSLREQLCNIFCKTESGLHITTISFGQKYGAQADVDMQFDVRCLPNPYYDLTLRHKTGLDDDVYNYVFSFNTSKEYYIRIMEMLTSLLPQFEYEGKTNLTVGFCCTGGKHRSVSFARKLCDDIQKLGYGVTVIHRDIDKEG